MQERKLTSKEREIIKSNFANKLVSIKDIIERSAKTITNATNYASIVYTGSIEDSEKYVQKFHDMNHFDPKVNPHSEVGPKFNENT